jgi:hypothetical protein
LAFCAGSAFLAVRPRAAVSDFDRTKQTDLRKGALEAASSTTHAAIKLAIVHHTAITREVF